MSGIVGYEGRFAESGGRVFQAAVAESQRRRQNYVSLWHIIQALAKEDAASFERLTRSVGLNLEMVEGLIEKAVALAPRHVGAGVRIAPEVTVLFREARLMARVHRRERIEAADMLLVLAQSVKLGPPWINTRWEP